MLRTLQKNSKARCFDSQNFRHDESSASQGFSENCALTRQIYSLVNGKFERFARRGGIDVLAWSDLPINLRASCHTVQMCRAKSSNQWRTASKSFTLTRSEYARRGLPIDQRAMLTAPTAARRANSLVNGELNDLLVTQIRRGSSQARQVYSARCSPLINE